MTVRTVCICILCIISVIFVLGIAGYFIFRMRVNKEKNAVRVKRHLKKNSLWWLCCWIAWLVIFILNWGGAKQMNDKYNIINFGLLFIAGMLLTILLMLDFFCCKYTYMTSQRVYHPDSIGLSRNKKKIMYKISGDTLKLWFNNAIMPKEYSIIEDKDKLEQMLRDNYKLNKLLR